MSLTRWDHLRDIADFRRSVRTLFGPDFRFGDPGFEVDIYETDDEVTVRAQLPGIPEDQIHIDLEETRLSIRVRRQLELPSNVHVIHRETEDGDFMRSFSLGVPVKADAIHASFTDGVVTIHMPKLERAKARRIEIRPHAEAMIGS